MIKKRVIKGTCQLRINKTMCSDRDDYIHLEIEDEKSHTTVAELRIPMEKFALAITGQSIGEIPVEYFCLDIVGKQYEHKTELIDLGEYPYKDFRAYFIKKVKPYEQNGWIADIEDCYNSHRQTPKGYIVIFRRWI